MRLMVNFKMTKKVKNIMFLILLCCFFGGIGLFNYSVDPYNVFHNKDYMNLSDVNAENILIKMKAYQDIRYDTVLIGSSEAGKMFDITKNIKHYFNCIFGFAGMLNYKNYYSLLTSYLKLHPETKNVIVVVSYTSFLEDELIKIPDFTGESYNLSEIIYLLWGDCTTGRSLNKFCDYILQKINRYKLFDSFSKNGDIENGQIISDLYPEQIDGFNLDKEYLTQKLQNNINYLNKVFDLLDEKNISYTLILPPYNATFLALINDNIEYNETFTNFIRYLTTKSDNIYDFALVNKYTTQDILSPQSYMYFNYNHPNFIWGSKIIKTLYYEDEAEPDIYIKLTKDNVEQVISEQDVLLKKYKKDYSKTFEKFKKESSEQENNFNPNKVRYIRYKDLPPEGVREMEYLDNKIRELEEQNNDRR